MVRRGQVSEEEKSKQCKKEQQIRGTKDNIVGGEKVEQQKNAAKEPLREWPSRQCGSVETERENTFLCRQWKVTSHD